MSIVLLNLCYELRKRNHVPSALQTKAGTWILLCLALHKLENWIFISTWANQRHLLQTVLTENWLFDKINIFMRMLSRESQLLCLKEILPFCFPSHNFRHRHAYITWMQRCQHNFLVLCWSPCATPPLLCWNDLPNWRADEDALEKTSLKQKSRD